MYDLFSPLGRENCWYFYILAVLSFAIFVVTLATALFNKKGQVNMALLALSPLVTYYAYRLLYSMCIRSL